MADDLDNILGDMSGLDSEGDDLDAILEALMAEKKEDEEEGRGPNAAFLEGIEKVEETVLEEPLFKPSVPPEGAVIFGDGLISDEEKKKRKLSLPQNVSGSGILHEIKNAPKGLRLAIMAMASVALLSFVGVAVVFAMSLGNTGGDSIHHINTPYGGFNTANHAFVDLSINLGAEELILRQILLDAAATTFYFEGEVDLTRYVLTLTDFDDNFYRRDVVFAENPARQLMLNHTAVRFTPISPESEGLTLSITDLETGVVVDVDLGYYGGDIGFARHFNYPITFETDLLGGIDVQLTQGLFSGGGSTVGLSLSHGFTDGGIVLKQREGTSSVVLRQGALFLPPISGYMQTASFDGGVEIARMDFGPLRMLGGEVRVLLDGLYRYFDRVETMPISPMLTPGDTRAQTLWLDANHTLQIAGITRQGPLFVMPLGGYRSGLVYDEDYNVWERVEWRVPTTMTANLMFTDDNGITQRIPASVRYDVRGTDVIFDTRLNENFEGVAGARISLEIERVYMNLPRTAYGLNLNIGDIAPDPQNVLRSNLIEAYFVQGAPTSPFDPFAQISTMKVAGDRVYAIVKEVQPTLQNGRLHHQILTHEVSGGFAGGEFVPQSIHTTR